MLNILLDQHVFCYHYFANYYRENIYYEICLVILKRMLRHQIPLFQTIILMLEKLDFDVFGARLFITRNVFFQF